MSIISEVERISTAKDDIKTALRNKNVLVSENATIDEYAGYIDSIVGGGNFQEKIVTPSSTEQVIIPDEEYDALSQVTITGDGNLSAENIKKDVTIFGIKGRSESVV